MTSEELLNILAEQTIVNQLWNLTYLFPGQVVFTTSFGMEDQVITDLIFRNDIPIDVVTLDTGRLFKETYSVFNSTFERYKKKIKVYFPDYLEVEKMMTEKGPFSFYFSKENRMECCHIRKVSPLQRILEGKKCWISGIRASQSETRGKMEQVEYDEKKSLFKFYPLFSWTFEFVEKYIRENNVPYNLLHDKGYVSIGCEPCTRAISEGEDFRSGRWWWETDSKKECGFHVKH
jgi:phosphoadenosine phosphosulfate reductase